MNIINFSIINLSLRRDLNNTDLHFYYFHYNNVSIYWRLTEKLSVGFSGGIDTNKYVFHCNNIEDIAKVLKINIEKFINES